MLVKERVINEKNLDNTIDLMKEGYLFIRNRAEKYQSDIFETRIMGEKAICLTGEEAVRKFYDSELFMRNGAAPKRVQKTLLGENAIQSMDGEAHLHRKRLFMSLSGQAAQEKLTKLMMEKLNASINLWKRKDQIKLFDEVNEILCQVACQWAGVPLQESEIKERAEDFAAMVDGFGAAGPRHWKGRSARNRAEDWIKEIMEEVRSGKLQPKEGTPLYEMAFHKELDGKQMAINMSVIELINLLRPIVAISTFITFAALALYEHPECKLKLVNGDEKNLVAFVQEVRRFYPFGPFLGARVRKDFYWKDVEFKQGTLVLLDMYGTNHDARIWKRPEEFNPDRFMNWTSSLFDFIPQGGGDAAMTHRCPGEGITIELMKVSIDFLVNKIEYDVPKQELNVSMHRMPTLPESGFIINNIRRKHLTRVES